MTTFVVVADGSRARLMKSEGFKSPLVEFEDLANPSGRMMSREQVSDRPGRSTGSFGGGIHSMDPRTDIKEQEQQEFAHLLGSRLELARTRRECDKMILVAAPAFLGLLRKELSPTTSRMITAEVDKDLVLETPRKIRSRLPYRI